MSFAAALVYSGRPVIGKYSWSTVGSFRRISVTCDRVNMGTTAVFREIACLFNNWEHPRLVVIVTVSTNAKIHFLRERIRLVSRCQLEDAEQKT
jgi:hypothetical protein